MISRFLNWVRGSQFDADTPDLDYDPAAVIGPGSPYVWSDGSPVDPAELQAQVEP